VGLSRQRAVAGNSVRWQLGDLADRTPEPTEEPLHSFYSRQRPLHVLVGRSDEQDRQTSRIGAEPLDELVGCGGASDPLRDLRAALGDEAVAEEALEGLAVTDQTQLVQHLHEVAGIDQVHRRMVDTAGVVVDRHPVVVDSSWYFLRYCDPRNDHDE